MRGTRITRPRWLAGAAVLVAAAGILVSPAPVAAAPDPAGLAIERATTAIQQNPATVRGSADDRYTAGRVVLDPSGAAHVRFQRQYRGLAVFGGDFVVHLRADGSFVRASVTLDAPLQLSVDPGIPASTALDAVDALPDTSITGRPLLAIDAAGPTPALEWRVPMTAPAGPGIAQVDARSGRVGRIEPDIEEASGTGSTVYSGTVTLDTTLSGSSYSLVDPVRGNAVTCDLHNAPDPAGPGYSSPVSSACATFTDADNLWGDGTPANKQSAAADVAYGTANAFDYYKNVLGRNGVFGNGTGVTSRVHSGTGYTNAFWNRTYKRMEYGDGAGDVKPVTSLDVAGHELTHGVTQATANLDYNADAGGLNEATSDVFGTMAEFYANNANDAGDYLIAEKDDIRGTGAPLRYMYQPSLDGRSPDCWSTGVASLDPHYSSGIGNHAFFLTTEGSGQTPYGTSPTCNNSVVSGIGRDKAAKIWYHALDAYFTSAETYPDARDDLLDATTDLYGACSPEWYTVEAAWTAVDVLGSGIKSCLKNQYYAFVCICIFRCPDPGQFRWVVDLPQWTSPLIKVNVNILTGRRGDLQLDLVAPTGDVPAEERQRGRPGPRHP